MLTYTFSRREKFLIGLFGLILIGVGWFQLVYVNTTDKLTALQAEVDEVQADILDAQTKLAKKYEMQSVIDQRVAEGAKATPIPDYDNIKPLMKDLSPITDMAEEFVISFDSVDTTTSTEYVLRGVSMRFTCETYEEIETILKNIANGNYPCVIDQTSIAPDRQGTKYSVSVHVVYYERPNAEMVAEREAKAAAEAAAAAAAAEASE